MSTPSNHLGQPIGLPLPSWSPPIRPPRISLVGHFSLVEPLDFARHAESLYQCFAEDVDEGRWTYLPYGPFDDRAEWLDWMQSYCFDADPQFYAITDPADGAVVGLASYLRINPEHGVIEVGHLNYSARLQRTPAATEAMYLMMKQAFQLGYRRYEWKCDSLNGPSRRAALRLGFQFEGIFRQAVVYKGRSRDTAWYSVIDSEWAALDIAFQQWLRPENFDDFGRQRLRLSELTASAITR